MRKTVGIGLYIVIMSRTCMSKYSQPRGHMRNAPVVYMPLSKSPCVFTRSKTAILSPAREGSAPFHPLYTSIFLGQLYASRGMTPPCDLRP